jgi:hypothetical protein
MRYFSVALLCILLAGCQARKSASLHIDPSLESLVPADTVAVVGAELDAVRGTAVYQKLLRNLPLPQLEEFTHQTGLDPRKDLSQILSCWDGKRGLFLARGKFRTAELEARLKTNGATEFDYKNRRLFGNEQVAIFLRDDSTVIAGPASELRSIIDGPRGNRGLPPALADLLRTLPVGDQIYAALIGGMNRYLGFAIPQGDLGNITQVAVAVDSAVVGMDLTNGINLIARANSIAERDAKFVHDMLKGLVGFGRLNTPDNQSEMLKLYDAIHVEHQQNQTVVTADIPADQVDRFLDLIPKRQ